ncbi:MAG: metallophosphoesterase family protein [Verrucomicrobiae bacterium]
MKCSFKRFILASLSIFSILKTHAATTLVFQETMAATNGVIDPWTGGNCDNDWSITGDALAQGTNWNYGTGNPCGLLFRQGTTNLSDNMMTTAQSIAVAGTAAYVEFYLKIVGATTNTAWAFQIDTGAGFSTRLNETGITNHSWQLFHYDLQTSELVSNLNLRFQFAGLPSSNRISLDRISIFVEAATNPPATGGFSGSLLLGRPTANSITVSAMSNSNLLGYFEYGTQSGVYSTQTDATNLPAGQPVSVDFNSLQANTRYYYRLRFKNIADTNFLADTEHTCQTQRARGSTFTFDIEADPHYNDSPGTVPSIWQQTLANVLTDQADFLIDLGDTFMCEKYAPTNPYTMTQPGIDEAYVAVRDQFFSVSGHSVPLFLVNGNHDPELGWWLSNSQPFENSPIWGAEAREYYYPCPIPGGFYSGATVPDFYQQQPRDGYYAFEWGDALFVMLDPFWYSNQGITKSKDPWAWTLGANQYFWLKSTLEGSSAKFKFIFAHHLIGGSFDSTARGGIEFSPYFEWGGLNTNGTSGFATHRPGWPMPIRDLLLTNKAQVFFHGHDHLFVKQDYYTSGVSNGPPDFIYQEVPQPSHYPYDSVISATDPNYNYTNGVLLGSSGHMRVTVSPTNALVEYVRSYRPTDTGKTNRLVAYSYSIPAPTNPVITLSGFGLVGGSVQLSISCSAPANCTIQASTDLIVWTNVFSTNVTVSPSTWVDTENSHYPRRFYRATLKQ